MYGYPPYTCITPAMVGQYTYATFAKIEQLYAGKQVVLTESGWPSSWNGAPVQSTANIFTNYGCTSSGDDAQRQAAQSIVDYFRNKGKPCTLFSAYREQWKGSSSSSVEEYWGICSGTYPYKCVSVPW
jgi:exo-beta-1,3-glucanase (GH17 family)